MMVQSRNVDKCSFHRYLCTLSKNSLFRLMIEDSLCSLKGKKNFPYLLKHFQLMDCKGKYCNYDDDGGNTESCQKCTDVEKCYKIPVR